MIRAVLGGSFDPVHLGHVALAEAVLERGLADSVVVVPAWLSPHKSAAHAGADQRLDLVETAFAGMPGVSVDDGEVRAGRAVATVETLQILRDRHPGVALRLVIGADHLESFHRWRDPGRIQELAEIILFARGGLGTGGADLEAAGLQPDRVIVVDDFDEPVSATTVRAILQTGRVPHDMLPAGVGDRIASLGLYGIAPD